MIRHCKKCGMAKKHSFILIFGNGGKTQFFNEKSNRNNVIIISDFVDIEFFMKWIESENSITYFDLDDDGINEKVLPSKKIRIPPRTSKYRTRSLFVEWFLCRYRYNETPVRKIKIGAQKFVIQLV